MGEGQVHVAGQEQQLARANPAAYQRCRSDSGVYITDWVANCAAAALPARACAAAAAASSTSATARPAQFQPLAPRNARNARARRRIGEPSVKVRAAAGRQRIECGRGDQRVRDRQSVPGLDEYAGQNGLVHGRDRIVQLVEYRERIAKRMRPAAATTASAVARRC